MAIQEIGIVIDLTKGTFNNTINKNNKLQLVEVGVDRNGKIVYKESGFWESEPILIQDKVASFKNLARTIETVGTAKYNAYTRTSEDGFTWSEYEAVASDGTIASLPARYAMIKIELFATKADAEFIVDGFDGSKVYDNEFVSTAGALALKKNYTFPMQNSLDNPNIFTSSEKIQKTKYKKLDSIRVGELM